MQIDAVGAVGHDFFHENACQAGGQGALLGSGKKAVQVAPVRQVSGMVDKTINIDHRNRNQGSRSAARSSLQ